MRLTARTLLWALAFALTIPSSAQAYVYWTNYGSSGSGTTIGRATLDGTGANQSFITGASGPVGVAVGGSHIYWANTDSPNCTGTRIGRANINGTAVNQSFINGADCAHEIDVNNTHIYWANRGVNGTGTTIGRANLDGSGVNASFIGGGAGPWGVAINATHIYWTNRGTGSASPCGGSIGVARLDGTGAVQNFITGVDGPTGIALDGSHVYWSNGCGTTIGRANLDGTDVNQSFITGASQPAGLAVDANVIYWANFANPTATGGGTTIGRAAIDGTGANQSFITGANTPGGIAVDTLPVIDPAPPPRGFGADTLVKLGLAAKRIPARGPVKVRVRNRNQFLVSGTLSGRRRRVKLKAKFFQVPANGKRTAKLKLPEVLRDLLASKGELTLRLTAKVTDPAGKTRTVRKRVTPKLKA